MRRMVLWLLCTVAFLAPRITGAADFNCTLRFSNGFVSDLYGMFDEADSQGECLTLCRVYGRDNVEIMANPDLYDPPVEILEWTCLYEKAPFYRRALKPTPDEGYLTAPDPSGAPPAETGAGDSAARPPHPDEIPAQIYGEAAGYFTYHAMACARLDESLTEAQLTAARQGLAAMKDQLSPDVHGLWDDYFQVGEASAKADDRSYDEESCAETLEILHKGGPFEMKIVPNQ